MKTAREKKKQQRVVMYTTALIMERYTDFRLLNYIIENHLRLNSMIVFISSVELREAPSRSHNGVIFDLVYRVIHFKSK